MFGRDYEEIGSAEKGLILKNSGKVKIQWGKKFIDLLDSNGNLNAKVQSLIKKVSSENEIKDDGFYYLDDSLIAKIGDNVLELTSESGTTFVSFMVEQETTDEQKYTALKNIGFVYREQSNTNIYPKNGIIYIEDSQSLFIVNNGTLSKYIAPIPNPFIGQFIISKPSDDQSEGALVINGTGKYNGLKFENLIIYSDNDISVFDSLNNCYFNISNKNIVKFTLEGIETESIKCSGANDTFGYRIINKNGKYTLDIDRINVRDGIDIDYYDDKYYDNNIYSKRFIIDYFVPIIPENSNIISYVLFNTNINNRDIIPSGSLVEIPIRVIECESNSQVFESQAVTYFTPINNIYLVEHPINNH